MNNSKRLGKQTVKFENPPSIISEYSIAGKKENEGKLKGMFDKTIDDAMYGEDSWEKAESKLMKSALHGVISKSEIAENDINYIFAGDLLNQCSGSHYAVRGFNIPFFGLYGACSTMAESLSLASPDRV